MKATLLTLGLAFVLTHIAPLAGFGAGTERRTRFLPAIQSNYNHEVHFKAHLVNRRNDILNGIEQFDIYDEIYS